jgi:hypothetical protein
MSKRVMSCVPAVCAGLLAAAIMLGTSHAALAADDCLAGPSRQPAQGGHWFYRLDHANNRKCWYLVEPEARAPTAEAPQSPPSPETAPQPSWGSFFSSLTAGFKGATGAAQPDIAGSDPRSLQPARPDDRRSEETSRQPRPVRHADQEAAAKPQRPARAPPERADEGAHNQTERDVLFQEFMRWRERQAP